MAKNETVDPTTGEVSGDAEPTGFPFPPFPPTPGQPPAPVPAPKLTIDGLIELLSAQKEVVAEVERVGQKLIIPEGMDYNRAIKSIQKKRDFEEHDIEYEETFPCFPWDGAYALKQAMEKVTGYALTADRVVEGMFGPIKKPPMDIQFEIEPRKKVSIPWGRYELQEDGYLECSAKTQDGTLYFQLTGEMKRKYKKLVDRIAEEVREILKTQSLMKGRAFTVSFFDKAGGHRLELPELKCLDVRKFVDPPIFSRETERAVQTNIWTSIQKTEACRQAGIPLKRGVLLTGKYGTGKTMLAHFTAHEAVTNGWTFLYVREVREVVDCIQLAQLFQPCVVFAEDVDRVVTSSRDKTVDAILNTLDGIEAKGVEILTILTTNHLESIHDALLRKGRIDEILVIEAPDAEAVERLLRYYGGTLVEKATLVKTSEILAGQIPATIREVIERAKLGAISRSGQASILLDEDLEGAAHDVLVEVKLVSELRSPTTPNKEALLAGAKGLMSMSESLVDLANGKHDKPVAPVRPLR